MTLVIKQALCQLLKYLHLIDSYNLFLIRTITSNVMFQTFCFVYVGLLTVWLLLFYKQYQQKILLADNNTIEITTEQTDETVLAELTSNVQYECDGRTHCSQMTSCEEATFFLQNCPGTKMDGNKDGVSCEKQWCK